MDIKEALLNRDITVNTAVVTIEGVGDITVRALSRMEFIRSLKLEDNRLKQEQFILSRAIVDPVMTEDDVAAWQRVSGFEEINSVATKINELSGIGKGADKSKVPGDGSEPVD